MEILNTKASLEEALSTNILEVTFIKVDGEHRYMKCTRDGSRIPPEAYPILKEEGSKVRVESPDVVRVYDFEVEGWRSFLVPNLISAKISL